MIPFKGFIKIFDPHTTPELETTQISITRGMEKYTVFYPYNITHYNNEKELTIHNTQIHTATKSNFTFVQWKKTLVTKGTYCIIALV